MSADSGFNGPLEPAHEFASERHAGQTYGMQSYVNGHLAEVVHILGYSGFRDDPEMLRAGWCHDIVEDTRTTIDEVRARFGDRVAHLVWAVTNEPGTNRKERALLTYPKIRAAGPDAVALKLCDRIANVRSCWDLRDARLFMYYKEYSEFRGALRRPEDGARVRALWEHLDKLLGWREFAPRSV